jgi:hypothetical protein
MDFHNINCQGKNWIHRVADKDTGINRHHGVVDEARLIYDQGTDKLYYGNHTDWAVITRKFDVIGQNTKMLFGYWPLPDGWTLSTTNNNMTIAITTDSNDIGTTEGSWTITGIQSAGGHNHGGVTGAADAIIASGSSDNRTPRSSWYDHTHTIQVDGDHIHGFDSSWKPAYQRFAEATFTG